MFSWPILVRQQHDLYQFAKVTTLYLSLIRPLVCSASSSSPLSLLSPFRSLLLIYSRSVTANDMS